MSTQVIKNGGFEDDAPAAPGWGFRCLNPVVYTDPRSARSGTRFVAVNNAPNTFPNPSIFQDVWIGWDGRYKLEFGIWIRSARPVPSDRRIILAIWHFWGGEPNPDCVAKTDPMAVSDQWQFYTVSGQSGGRSYRLEAYWHDNHPVDVNFDDAFCNVEKLS